MIVIDSRTGSKELAPLFEQIGAKYTLGQLEAGDFAFDGNTPKGPSRLGVERKTIRDLLQSMQSGRLVDVQIPRMLDLYDRSYLIVEGLCRANPWTGMLEEACEDAKDHKRIWWREVTLGRQRFMWEHFDHFLCSLEWTPVRVRRTTGEANTVRNIISLHSYHQREWKDHKSLRTMYFDPWNVIPLQSRENPVRSVARELPGIGVEKSLACQMKWRSPFDMIAMSTSEDWQSLPGVGPKTARKILNWIHGEKDLDSQTDWDAGDDLESKSD